MYDGVDALLGEPLELKAKKNELASRSHKLENQ